MRAHAADMAALAAPGTVLIEFGSGSSTKTELLLAEMRDLYAYVPIDISGAALDEAQARIETRFPELTVLPVRGDFSCPLTLSPDIAAHPRLGFFPGSTIGNLTEGEAVQLLTNMRRILGDDGKLIIGADLRKDVRRLLAAYDDAAGVTAAFNLNLLRRANRELGADFDVAALRAPRHLRRPPRAHRHAPRQPRRAERHACSAADSASRRASASTPSIRTSTISRASRCWRSARVGSHKACGPTRSACSACTSFLPIDPPELPRPRELR